MKMMSNKEAKQPHNKKMGIGCGTSIIAFIIMIIMPAKDSALGGLITLIFLASLIYGFWQYHETNVVRGNHFRAQLPSGFNNHITLTPHKAKNTFSISRHFGDIGTTKNPAEGDMCLCVNTNNKRIIFWHNNKLSNQYYLTSVSFTPNIQTSITQSGKANGRLGSALVGGVLLGPIGAAIGAARKRKITLHSNTNQTEYGTNAYLQLVTNNFKNIKNIKLTNAKTSDYNILVQHYMLSDLELKRLSAKHGIFSQGKKGQSSEDDADKITKMKKLLDQHVINQQDFDNYKNKLLNNQ